MTNISQIAIAPGETIKEQLELRHLSLSDFSSAMEMREAQALELLNGSMKIDDAVAQNLENVLGISKLFWLRLEYIYRNKLKHVNYY